MKLNKFERAAHQIVQGNHNEATPAALLARMLEIGHAKEGEQDIIDASQAAIDEEIRIEKEKKNPPKPSAAKTPEKISAPSVPKIKLGKK